MSAAFLASQSTPTMSVVAGYLWFRLCFEACLKVGGDWQLVKDLGFRDMNEVMSAATTLPHSGASGCSTRPFRMGHLPLTIWHRMLGQQPCHETCHSGKTQN
jgi:hypothetical protein